MNVLSFISSFSEYEKQTLNGEHPIFLANSFIDRGLLDVDYDNKSDANSSSFVSSNNSSNTTSLNAPSFHQDDMEQGLTRK
jgi:hypothetical protein